MRNTYIVDVKSKERAITTDGTNWFMGYAISKSMVLCSCTGNTKATATPFIFKKNKSIISMVLMSCENNISD